MISMILNIVPNIPSVSQDEHLSFQCGGENDPHSQVFSWSKATLPCSSRSVRSTQNIYISGSATTQVCPSNASTPTLHLSKYSTTTFSDDRASEEQSTDTDDTFACTFKGIVIDHILNLLPGIPSISQDDQLSIQCGVRQVIYQLSVPSQNMKGFLLLGGKSPTIIFL